VITEPYFQKAIVQSNQRLGSSYTLLKLKVPKKIDGLPGQFAMLRGDWKYSPLWARAFSLLRAGTTPSFLIKLVGEGTHRLANLRAGDAISINAPLGRPFSIPARGRRALLIAGGVGAAPLFFLLNHLVAKHHTAPLVLYGGRSLEDLPLAEKFSPQVELMIMTEDGSAGRKGLVTSFLDGILKDSESSSLYACGPIPMLKEVSRLSRQAGTPCEVSFETTMACGMGLCLGCAVPSSRGGYLYLCEEGPVVNAESLDWNRIA